MSQLTSSLIVLSESCCTAKLDKVCSAKRVFVDVLLTSSASQAVAGKDIYDDENKVSCI